MKKPKTVLTTGAFDLLHPGHLFLLRHARRLAGPRGKVIVVIARDETVRRRKGRPPVLGEKARLEVVRSIRYVDEATLGYRPLSFEKIIDRYRPDIVLFGYNQREVMENFREVCLKKGWKIKIAIAPRLGSSRISSSALLQRAARIVAKRDRAKLL